MSFAAIKGYQTKPKPGVMLNPLHPLSRGLVGQWMFNEGAGSRAYDISGKGNHGTLTNMAPNTQGSGWGGSKFGGGLEFDGVNDYVDCGNDASLRNHASMTVSFWMNYNFTTDFQYGIISHFNGNNVGNENRIGIDYYDRIIVWYQMGGSGGNIFTPLFGTVVDGVWHHVTVVLTNGFQQIYINGVPSGDTGTIVANLDGGTQPLYIGDTWGLDNFNGSIDSVRFYNRALSAAEAKQLYHDPFCNLLQVPTRYVAAAGPSGAIMNQFQKFNIGADLYNGGIIA